MLPTPIHLVIADEQQIFVESLKAFFANIPYIRVVGQANNYQHLNKLLHSTKPHLLITDVKRDGKTDLSALKNIRKHHPNQQVLVMSLLTEDNTIVKLVQMGISGHVSKKDSVSNLMSAIRSIMNQGTFFDQNTTQIIMARMNKRPRPYQNSSLTNREKEITVLIAEGFNSNQIANKLSLSQYTIETHRKNIFLKAGVSNVAKLVRYAIREQLID